MVALLISWLLSALSLIIVAYLLPGFSVDSFGTALIAAIVVGLINATFGLVIKILTFPLTVITFGLFLLVLNALLLQFAAGLVPGFMVQGFVPAFVGAIVLALVNMVLRAVVFSGVRDRL